MVKKMNDKLEEMEKAAALDVYDNQQIYGAVQPEIYAKRSSVHGGGGIYGGSIYGRYVKRNVLYLLGL